MESVGYGHPHIHSHSRDTWSGEQISKGVQDFIICIEMFLFAIAFTFTFPYKDFQSSVESQSPLSVPHTPRAGKAKVIIYIYIFM